MNKKEIGKRVWELFTEGYSYNKIAKKLKISKSVVSNVINYCSPCSYSLSKKITQKLKELEEENKKLKELEQENEKLKNNLQELQELQNLQETKHIILGLIIFVLSILIPYSSISFLLNLKE